MMRPRGRKQEREVPAWKQALARADAHGDEDDDDSSPHLGAEVPDPELPLATVEPSSTTGASGSNTADASGSGGGGDDENGEEEDDDDDDFDPRNYDLDDVGDAAEAAEAQEPELPLDGSPSGTDACRLAVANLAFETKDGDLLAFMSSCGGLVVAIEMPDLTLSKRTAFVTFATEAMAQAALALTGRRLSVPGAAGQRKLTILLAPIGSTPSDDMLKYDLLHDSVTVELIGDSSTHRTPVCLPPPRLPLPRPAASARLSSSLSAMLTRVGRTLAARDAQMRVGKRAPVPDPSAFGNAGASSSSEPDAKRARHGV